MKILVVGGGGREHAICWKIRQSQKVQKIYCAPGNAGTAEIAENVPIQADDIQGLLDFAVEKKIDLTVVGPEAPLVNGIVDKFEKAGLKIFGPDSAAAMIEGSKVFAKNFMRSAGIPTADFVVLDDPDMIEDVVNKFETAAVKVDGLAAGKGVIICKSKNEIRLALERILVAKEFGDAGKKVVVEELLDGEEASMLAFCDGKRAKLMLSAQDHKRVFDNDEGPNTGGMGAYCPAPVVNGLEKNIFEKIFVPAMREFNKKGIAYKGVLYAGLMINNGSFKVLEFNARLGDPEAQVILPLLDSDFVDLAFACISGNLDKFEIKWKKGSACCVVLASKGYPGNYKKGFLIRGLDNFKAFEGVIVFHSGTIVCDGGICTNGGRVMSVVGIGQNIKEAIERAYVGVSQIDFEGMHFRTDIGKKALQRK